MDIHTQTFIHHGTKDFDPNIAYHNKPLSDDIIQKTEKEPYMQAHYNKNINGLWSCIYTPNQKYRSAWDEFARSARLRTKKELNDFFTFKIKESSRILTIKSFDDIRRFGDKYFYFKENERKKELFHRLLDTKPNDSEYKSLMTEYFKQRKYIVLLKANNIMKDYDALYITDDAIHNINDAFSFWDVETLLIFNTSIINPYSINSN